jgi:hypothetical protein
VKGLNRGLEKTFYIKKHAKPQWNQGVLGEAAIFNRP